MTVDCRRSQQHDGGFTLIELLIVVTIMGVLMSVLSAAFLVIVKSSPSTEVRIDDARSTRGLATWLSHDTTSTPPYQSLNDKGWIDTNPGAGNCGGSGDNIVEFSWQEVGFTNETFYANYRYVPDGGDASVVRYSCSSIRPTSSLNLTSGLDPADAPEAVPIVSDGDVIAVNFVLHSSAGEDVIVQTGSRNPVEFYP